MVITRLELFRFKRFKQAHFDFKPGVNVIKGPNEAGKSTLRAALMAVLFGNPTSSSETVQSWTTWGDSERCELRLEYVNHSGQACQLRKDFSEGKVFLTQGQETFRTAKKIQDLLIEELGIPTEDFYSLCASLDVRSLANLGNAALRKEIGKMLSGLMTGTANGQDSAQALKKLDEAIKEIGKGLKSPSKVPGPLKAGRDEMTTLMAQRAELEKRLTQRQQKARELETVETGLSRGRKRLADLQHLLDANAKLVQASRRKEELVQQDAQYDRAVQARQKTELELETLARELEQNPSAGLSAEEISELQNLTQKQARLAETKEPALSRGASQLWMVLGAVAAGLGLLCLMAKVWALLILLLVIAAGLFLVGRREGKKRAQMKAEQRNRIQALQKEKEDVKRRLEALQAQARGMKPEDILQAWPKAQQLTARRDAAQRQLNTAGAVDQEHWKNLRSELRGLDDVLNDPELAPLRLSPAPLAERQRERSLLEKQVADASQQQASLRAMLSQDSSASDQLSGMDERLAELKERLAGLEAREKILRRTFDFLEQARRETLNPAREVLEQAAGELFRKLSRDRYKKIMMDDEDLSGKVCIPETGRWDDPAILSQGTFDQFYLSLRLALSDILAGGKNPPLLLDEPFAAFDAERLARAFELLRLLAATRQIFLFTCRPDCDPAADHVIELSREESRT